MEFLFLALAQLVLLTMKAAGVTAWSWATVLFPVWLAIGLFALYAICFFISLRYLDRL